MSEYDERTILVERNIKALNEGMKHFEKMRQEDRKRVEAVMSTLTMLQIQVEKLTVDVALLKAHSVGRGSTSKG